MPLNLGKDMHSQLFQQPKKGWFPGKEQACSPGSLLAQHMGSPPPHTHGAELLRPPTKRWRSRKSEGPGARYIRRALLFSCSPGTPRSFPECFFFLIKYVYMNILSLFHKIKF